jgi:hypothetical protein
LPTALLSFPPLDKKIAGTFVPAVAAIDFMQGDEAPEALGFSDFLDQSNAFLERHAAPGCDATRWRGSSLGVYFPQFIDTTSMALLGTNCNQKAY